MLPELSRRISTLGWMLAPKMSLSSALANGGSGKMSAAIRTSAVSLFMAVPSLCDRAVRGHDVDLTLGTARTVPGAGDGEVVKGESARVGAGPDADRVPRLPGRTRQVDGPGIAEAPQGGRRDGRRGDVGRNGVEAHVDGGVGREEAALRPHRAVGDVALRARRAHQE